jgi:predicted transcriptional regulator
MKIVTEPSIITPNSLDSEEEEEQLSDIPSKLLKCISVRPGIRYRELLRLAGLTNGVLTYHTSSLEKSGHIKVDRNNKSHTTRYYPNYISAEQSKIIGYIRINTVRQIIQCIIEYNNNSCTFNEIVEYTKRSASTISWHLKRLKDAGIVSVQYSSRHHHQHCYHYQHVYKLVNIELVTDVLYKYKESLIDKVVNNYIEIIEDL